MSCVLRPGYACRRARPPNLAGPTVEAQRSAVGGLPAVQHQGCMCFVHQLTFDRRDELYVRYQVTFM